MVQGESLEFVNTSDPVFECQHVFISQLQILLRVKVYACLDLLAHLNLLLDEIDVGLVLKLWPLVELEVRVEVLLLGDFRLVLVEVLVVSYVDLGFEVPDVGFSHIVLLIVYQKLVFVDGLPRYSLFGVDCQASPNEVF